MKIKIYEFIHNIKMKNPEDKVLKEMIIVKLLINIKENPELKSRIIITTSPNINNNIMNVNGINELLYHLGYILNYDGILY